MRHLSGSGLYAGGKHVLGKGGKDVIIESLKVRACVIHYHKKSTTTMTNVLTIRKIY